MRGFAVKFYTEEGNFDLVGNNIPVFFIQDAIKFPDLIHAVKPEPHNEIPQAASAHDTFWDFVSLMPESMHMIMWAMSDRAIPRSLRMMEGFGIHTFRLINDKGQARFVKFHWKPLLGVHSVVWDEATKISGKDPDFHRRDLWEAIESGAFPEWEFGVQIVEEKDEHKFDFDLLDPTKLIPEELVPVQRIGKLTLNRNPDNFFAETEQVAFHPGHIVPGIDFTNDPLLQGRLFSYLDTQLMRLGGPNFHEIPINRPVAPVHNNQRDGLMRQTINHGQTQLRTQYARAAAVRCRRAAAWVASSRTPSVSTARRCAREARASSITSARRRCSSTARRRTSRRTSSTRCASSSARCRAPPFGSGWSACLRRSTKAWRPRSRRVSGSSVVPPERPLNHSIPADGKAAEFESRPAVKPVKLSPALSMARPAPTHRDTQGGGADGIRLRQVGDRRLGKALAAEGAKMCIVGPHLGALASRDGADVQAEFSLLTASSVLFDALYSRAAAEPSTHSSPCPMQSASCARRTGIASRLRRRAMRRDCSRARSTVHQATRLRRQPWSRTPASSAVRIRRRRRSSMHS